MSKPHQTNDAQEALIALVGALEARDSFSNDHSRRVSQIAMRLAKIFKLDEQAIKEIGNAGLLHDIGMVSVPDGILLKPGSFTKAERQVIREAPGVAGKILKPIKSLKRERLMVLHHGERWDGSGYPDGLKQEKIPVGARFIAIAEAIDAMTQNRAYRRARPLSFCLEQLEEGAGSQFDPKIAKVAIAALAKGLIRDLVEKKET
ncbi:HD-GYP domain-containing protein [Mariprofundus sp. NF]|uniref:HD-GYP domain-containing protein n=1 Tax=Mariprofundus sp. NF TaxID=2608716 RepID=UPI001F50A97C|nr:HD domain-containing phosphohydrolase [Mariprofundus sp. NF]